MSGSPILALLRAIAADSRGTMIIETAIVGPVLILLALGAFEVTQIISRQHELQIGVAEAEAIVLAANSGAATDTTALAGILRESLSLSGDHVAVTKLYRCNADPEMVASAGLCEEDDVISTYIRIQLRDSYSPLWTSFGVSQPFAFTVVRTVQLS
ncbi:MAG TPA: TadE/TadG family type IV pilus assembly protein [Novosphingobium sp.]|nr:TadE/TadG family type IV pilus assembly protein [Novosphingobium sp.]